MERWPLSIRELEFEGHHYRRDATWRPLTKEEINFFASLGDVRIDAVFSVDDCYWMKPPLRSK